MIYLCYASTPRKYVIPQDRQTLMPLSGVPETSTLSYIGYIGVYFHCIHKYSSNVG